MRTSSTGIVTVIFLLMAVLGCADSQEQAVEVGLEQAISAEIPSDPTPNPTASAPPTNNQNENENENENADEQTIAEAVEKQSANTVLAAAKFTIVPGESQARFELDEHLRSALTGWNLGARNTVVGTTDQVSGSFSFSPTQLDATQFDDLRLDAHSFSTSDYYRTLTIQKLILESKTYPEIVFSPTGLRDMPAEAAVNEAVRFTLDGDLTIRDITLAQSFAVTATLVAPNRVEGTATALVSREAYALEITNAPHVSNVEDEVELYIDFVAISD